MPLGGHMWGFSAASGGTLHRALCVRVKAIPVKEVVGKNNLQTLGHIACAAVGHKDGSFIRSTRERARREEQKYKRCACFGKEHLLNKMFCKFRKG